MSPPLEHDYIGLSDAAAAAAAVGGGGRPRLNLKETELRLGLPGSESPGRIKPPGLTLDLLPAKPAAVAAIPTFVSGAKRGFSDAIDGNGNGSWAGSEVETGKGGALFSPKGHASAAAACGGTKEASLAATAGKAQVPSGVSDRGMAPASKAQVVGWPPIRSYRKNTMATNPLKNKEDAEMKQQVGCLYVKVSMDGAPYLRKVDLNTYCNYEELSLSLEKMFSGFTGGQCSGNGIPSRDGLSESRLTDILSGSEYVLTYEDKDGDWMLVGDVRWEMFTELCRRLRIMKGSDAIGLAPRAMEKCKNQK